MNSKDFDRIDKKLGLTPTKKQVNEVKYRFSYSIFHDNYSVFHKTGKSDLEYQLDLMIWDNDLKVWKDPNYIFDVPKRVVNRFIYETPTPKGHNPRGRGWYPENNQKSSIWKKLHFKKYDLCHECGIEVHKPRKRRGKLNSRMPKYCLDCKEKVHNRNITKGRAKRRMIRNQVGLMGELSGHRFKGYLISVGKGKKRELITLVNDPSCVWKDQDARIERGIKPENERTPFRCDRCGGNIQEVRVERKSKFNNPLKYIIDKPWISFEGLKCVDCGLVPLISQQRSLEPKAIDDYRENYIKWR